MLRASILILEYHYYFQKKKGENKIIKMIFYDSHNLILFMLVTFVLKTKFDFI